MSELPSPETLRKLLRYEPATGQLFWRERDREFFPDDRAWKIWNTRYAGAEAGHTDPTSGYRKVGIFDHSMQAHRVIWAMETGAWPEDQIDHEDHNRLNNRWINLREATNAENGKNMSMSSRNKSGVTGVHWHKQRGKWVAYINHDGKRNHLGLFDSINVAVDVRAAAERELGFHENHGRVA